MSEEENKEFWESLIGRTKEDVLKMKSKLWGDAFVLKEVYVIRDEHSNKVIAFEYKGDRYEKT